LPAARPGRERRLRRARLARDAGLPLRRAQARARRFAADARRLRGARRSLRRADRGARARPRRSVPRRGRLSSRLRPWRFPFPEPHARQARRAAIARPRLHTPERRAGARRAVLRAGMGMVEVGRALAGHDHRLPERRALLEGRFGTPATPGLAATYLVDRIGQEEATFGILSRRAVLDRAIGALA